MSLFLQTKRYLLLLFLLTGFCLSALAQTIHGNVSDAKSGETLVGATVHIEHGSTVFNTTVKLDGDYTFKNVPAGDYKLHVSFVGYKTTKDYDVDVDKTKTAVLNIAMVDNSTSLNEVVVTEHASRGSEKSARNNEKNSSNTINAVSAQAIAISPDVLVSNVLARVSGISVDRSSTGDAQHVIIRGMDKQYNTTLINGIKIPSPDNTNRYVPLDIFPAGLVDRIDVYKTLTPDMEGDATGGVINLVMKTAPDHLTIDGELGTGYSQIFFDRPFSSFDHGSVNSKAPGEINPGGVATPADFPYQNLLTKKANASPNTNVSLTIGKRFLDDKLGVMFSGSYQNLYQGQNSFAVVQSGTVGPPIGNSDQNQETAFESSYNRQYSTQLQRLGAIASIDYKFDQNNTINLFATYLALNEYRVRQTQEDTYGGYTYQGYRGTFSVDNLTETRSDLQSISNITLSGKHKISNPFSIDWTIASSEAIHKTPDDAEFDTQYGTSPTSTTSQATGNPNEPNVSVANGITNGPTLVQNESRLWTHNTDKDISGYLNLHYGVTIFGRKAIFSAGGMVRHKTRDNFVDKYSLPNTVDNNGVPEAYTTIPDAKFIFTGADTVHAKGNSATSAGVYTFTENVEGAYAMVKYSISDRLDFTAGLRGEHTYQYYTSNLPVIFPGKTATITYTDYLPSINLKYTLTDNQALRASYFKSILRPAFADLIPYADPTGEIYQPIGNPYLQHTVINNYDVRYEFFPGVFDELMIGGFYKKLINPIETVYTGLYLEPENLGNAQNYGAELEAKKFFGNIGGEINYTYTSSKNTIPKSIDLNGQITMREQTIPLQGQATNVGNASLLYKNQRYGVDAQLSLAYVGERIQAVSNYYNLDTWERPSTYLDASAQKKIGHHFIVYAKANNLLNTPYQLIIKQNNTYNYTGIAKYPHQESAAYTTVEYDQFYARYNLGVKYNF